MFSSFSLPFSLGSLGSRKRQNSLTVPALPADSETASDPSSKRLHALLKLNHANHSIIYNELRFHNHTPHILGSSYFLGATPDQLTKIYETESANIDPWRDSPGEISEDDWRDYLGKKKYQRAYIDFFEDQLVAHGYDWKSLLDHFLNSGEAPLITSLVSGLGHPLIHLGYAYELGSRTVAIEALGLATCFYDNLQKYVDDPSYTFPVADKTTSILTIFERVRADHRLDGMINHLGMENFDVLLSQALDIVLEHWNSWDATPSTLKDCLLQMQEAAVALVVATPDYPPKPPQPGGASSTASDEPKSNGAAAGKYYDFFFLHCFTMSHAVRIILPLLPDKSQVPLVRSWLLFVLLAYMSQMRPRIDLALITDFPLKYEDGTGDADAQGKAASWKYVKDAALNGPHAMDPHYVKPLRALMVAEDTWGDSPVQNSEALVKFWRKAAVRMAGEFIGWGGYDAETEAFKRGLE